MRERIVTKITWGATIIAISAISIVTGVQQLKQDGQMAEWIPDLTIGTLLLITYSGHLIALRLETDEPRGGSPRLSALTGLVGFAAWFVAGLALTYAGYTTFMTMIFTVLGAVGFAGMLYSVFHGPESESTAT